MSTCKEEFFTRSRRKTLLLSFEFGLLYIFVSLLISICEGCFIENKEVCKDLNANISDATFANISQIHFQFGGWDTQVVNNFVMYAFFK